MVRVNIIDPKYLADQHLIAEYNEILMLFGYVKKHPRTHFKDIPECYRLGQGHILFFKNKLKDLKKRFEKIVKEMKKRGFRGRKRISFVGIDKNLVNDWKTKKKDKEIIKKRLIEKIKNKPGYYRYYKERKTKKFFLNMIKNAK